MQAPTSSSQPPHCGVVVGLGNVKPLNCKCVSLSVSHIGPLLCVSLVPLLEGEDKPIFLLLSLGFTGWDPVILADSREAIMRKAKTGSWTHPTHIHRGIVPNRGLWMSGCWNVGFCGTNSILPEGVLFVCFVFEEVMRQRKKNWSF